MVRLVVARVVVVEVLCHVLVQIISLNVHNQTIRIGVQEPDVVGVELL